jgi:hypothetical protein
VRSSVAIVLCAACLAVGFVLALVLRPPQRSPILPGDVIEVWRPTGETMSGANGTGETRYVREHLTLRVFRSGSRMEQRAKVGPVWDIDVGGVKHVAERVEE